MNSFSAFSLVFIALLFLSSSVTAEEKACEDDPNVDCKSFADDCADPKLLPLLKASCPVTCKLCPPTEPPTTPAPCEDAPGANCDQLKSDCDNGKYIPMLKEYCPVTCNLCPGATTVPPTPNPNCYDSGSNCANWVKKGFCTNCFYKCSEKLQYCAKSCGFCTPGSCKDCNNFQRFLRGNAEIDFSESDL